KMIFALTGLGLGRAAVARVLNVEGHVRRNARSWTRRQVAAILARRDFYRRGAIRYGLVTAVGRTPALLESPTDDVVTDAASGPNRQSRRNPTFGSDPVEKLLDPCHA